MAGKSMKEVIESGELKRFADPRIIKALGHPIREHILAVLNERIASASEIGRDIDLDVPAFYHHVEALEEFGCIERVATKRHRGATEHFFRAKATLVFDDRAWQQVPASVRSDITVSSLQSIWDEGTKALQAGIFAADAETHMTWLPGVFDRRGWDEAMKIMDEALARLKEAQERSAERVAAAGEPGIPATIAMMGFGTGS